MRSIHGREVLEVAWKTKLEHSNLYKRSVVRILSEIAELVVSEL